MGLREKLIMTLKQKCLGPREKLIKTFKQECLGKREKLIRTLKQKCLGQRGKESLKRDAKCLGQYLEVFTFQLWALSKFGLTSIGGGLALEKTGKKVK